MNDSYTTPGNRDRALIDKLKDALRPADARRPHGDMTHDGRHGGIEQVMDPGHRDYHDEPEDRARRRGSLDELGSVHHERKGSGGSTNSVLGRLYPEQQSKEDDVMKKGETGRLERQRDSTKDNSADGSRLSRNFYQTIRDDFGG
ncbi:hypothetical protein GGS21DRAFT_302474 [Xylaria nigripes]|nr:hypothetical protein GGS21DRAFT_302474 [Xylaria nigripes]